jgi:Tfp pilus assembly protein PilF
MGGENVSTRGVAFTLGAVLMLTACASTTVSEPDRLRAQAAYERALTHISERQASPALGALKEAVSIDPNVAAYRDTLGLVYLPTSTWAPPMPRSAAGTRPSSATGGPWPCRR